MSKQTDVVSLNTTDLLHQTKPNDWGNDWVITFRTFLLPIITLSGILINVASVVVLMKKRIRLKRALTKFFAFLNISDTILLALAFQLFSMPRLSKWYDEGLQNYITPYLYPIMQTSLTTSVYMTVVIAVYAFVYIKPVPKGPEEEDSNDDDDPEDKDDDLEAAKQDDDENDPTMQMNTSSEVENVQEFNHPGFGTDSRKTVNLTILSVMAFGLVFNAPRWLEIQRTDTWQWDEETKSNITKAEMKFTDLRKNSSYVRWYSLIGSTIVMILLPILILVTTYISLCRTIPRGSTKKRTVSIVVVIIFMFIICHLPKAFLTGYEIIYMGSDKSESMSKWPNSFKAFNEINTFLLVAYSALNPFAYCGKLIFTELKNGLDKCSRRQPQSATELDAMRSFGISLNGPDPLQQQLKELDIQSKLMCGIQVYPPTPTRSSKSSSRGSRSSQPGPSLKPTPQAV